MRYTLAHIWSGIRSRLRDPAAAEPAAITLEANAALLELRGRMRQSREDWLDATETTDMLADKDVYDYPAAADTLKMIERLDLQSEHGVYPSQVIGYHERFARQQAQDAQLIVADTVTVLPGRRIQIQPAPTAGFKNGLRWTFVSRAVDMASPEDAIGVDDRFGEWLIVATMDRMRQFRGIALSDPQSYEQFRKEQTARLLQELRPKELLAPPRIIDEDEFYQNLP